MKTNNKLIKLSDTHYIVVDYSRIKENQWYCNNKVLFLSDNTFDEGNNPNQNKNNKLVTHSTQPLEQYYGAPDGTLPFVYHKIKPLSLSEVEEVINGYSVEKLVTVKYGTNPYNTEGKEGYKEGFKLQWNL